MRQPAQVSSIGARVRAGHTEGQAAGARGPALGRGLVLRRLR